jgi:serine/threonine protein kinase
MLGETLGGRYQIMQELGAGGFGKTYLARDTQLPGEPVCVVKQLQPQSSDPSLLQIASRLFQGEAEVLQQLGQHPQIPRLLAHFEQDQNFFLVQEFIDGSDLSHEVKQGRKWTEVEVKQLLTQVLAPLNAAHQAKVIHRDIKPANLMRRRSDGEIFLIDFGAVKQVAVSKFNPLSNTVGIGTQGYMPIEQILGKPHLGGSDVYALGIVALQALTGVSDATALIDEGTAQIQWRHLATVSPEFGAILDKMVANMVVNRYQSAAEVLEAIAALSTPSSPVVVGQSDIGWRSGLKIFKNPLYWLACLVMGGGAIAWGWPKQEVATIETVATSSPIPSIQASQTSSTPKAQEMAASSVSTPTISPLASSAKGTDESYTCPSFPKYGDTPDPNTYIPLSHAMYKELEKQFRAARPQDSDLKVGSVVRFGNYGVTIWDNWDEDKNAANGKYKSVDIAIRFKNGQLSIDKILIEGESQGSFTWMSSLTALGASSAIIKCAQSVGSYYERVPD